MEFKPASNFTLAQIAECFNKSFHGYIAGNFTFTADELAKHIAKDGISLDRSLVGCNSEGTAPVAFSFIALREDRPTLVRLAAFGVVPELKGQGVGSKLVEATIKSERARGVKVIELEVIKQNDAGFALYKKMGFTIHQELFCWERDALAADELKDAPSGELEECTVAQVRELVRKYAVEDLPWQPWMLLAPDASRAYKLGDAYCVISDPEDEASELVKLQSLIVRPGSRGQGQATRLASAIMAKFPGKKWRTASAIYPKAYGDSLAKRLGFHEHNLSQYQMRYYLD
jgi:ribosomal protein S18 acetylase RimI-like enzyme